MPRSKRPMLGFARGAPAGLARVAMSSGTILPIIYGLKELAKDGLQSVPVLANTQSGPSPVEATTESPQTPRGYAHNGHEDAEESTVMRITVKDLSGAL